jgi:hypothetical protein
MLDSFVLFDFRPLPVRVNRIAAAAGIDSWSPPSIRLVADDDDDR